MALHSNVLEKEQEPRGSKFNGQAAAVCNRTWIMQRLHWTWADAKLSLSPNFLDLRSGNPAYTLGN
jgi:hypothetical protein